jgi:hypothetical protein
MAREHVQLAHGPGCMCIRHQQERAEAAAKVERPAVPVERVTKARKAAAVSNAKSDAKPVSNGAARIARWRAKQDPEVRKQQSREAVQRHRAKKKAVAS